MTRTLTALLCVLLLLPATAELLPVNIEAVGITGDGIVVALDGDDSNPGTEEAPMRSLQAAADKLQPGQTLFIREGTWENDHDFAVLELKNSGTADAWIRITRFPGDDRPLFRFNSLRGIRVAGASYLLIDGFEFDGRNDELNTRDAQAHCKAFGERGGDGYDNPEYFGVGIRIGSEGDRFPHHVIARDHIIHDCSGGGISTARADYVLIEDNVVFRTSFYTPWGGSAISVWQSSNHDNDTSQYRTVIRNNTCFGNDNRVKFWMMDIFSDGNGIIIDATRNTQGHITNDGYSEPYNGRTLIANNVCYLNGGRGVNIYESDNIDVVHNTLYRNATRSNVEQEIELGRTKNVRIYNNIIVPSRGKHAIGGYQTEDIRTDYNLVYGVKPHGGFGFGDHTIDGRPRFRKGPTRSILDDDRAWQKVDFRQHPRSASIDAATAAWAVDTDKDGRDRSEHAPADAGAYEFAGE